MPIRRTFISSTLAGFGALQFLGGAAFAQSSPNSPARRALSGIGLNSIANWTGARDGARPRWRLGDTNEEVHQVFRDGFDHLCFITRVDQFFVRQSDGNFTGELIDDVAYRVANRLRDQMQGVISQTPDAFFVISFKGYEQVGGWDAPGIKQSYFARSFEASEEVQRAFLRLWGIFSSELGDISQNNLAFNLMNEPEYHTFSSNIRRGRDAWCSLAEQFIDYIRTFNANRLIIVEAVDKGLFYRHGNSPSSILRPIQRSEVLHAFHYYGPDSWTHQINSAAEPLTNSHIRSIRSDLRGVVQWTADNNVNTIMSEVGVWGPFFEDGIHVNGATSSERARYAQILRNELVDNGIGITWWALHDNNTPYVRIVGSEGSKIQPELRPDVDLWNALGLNLR
jgi:hypothetical protein